MALPAVIEIALDAVVQVGGLDIRWQTIGVTVALLAGLALAAAIVNRSARGLRMDDLGYLALGSVPGAVVGGRIVHGLAYWEFYATHPLRLIDPSAGSLSLLGAVLGGTLSAAYVATLLGSPRRRWADATAVPLLVILGLGKIAQFLGGSGQGTPFDGPWAVAFVGDGAWHSLNPDLPAHPAQLYEALWLLAGLPLVLAVGGPGRDFGPFLARPLRVLAGPVRRDGTLFALVAAWFLLGRLVVGFTWRDDALIGPLNAEQAVALVALLGGLITLAIRRPKAAGRADPDS